MKLNLSIFMFFVLWINQISAQPEILEKNISEAFGNIVGGIVFIDADNKKISYNETLIEEKFPPCSTFKIWNALIGLEYGIITSLDEKFYTWDGVTRSIPDWNKNLILREAFKVSCVPAFQNLAQKSVTKVCKNGLILSIMVTEISHRESMIFGFREKIKNPY